MTKFYLSFFFLTMFLPFSGKVHAAPSQNSNFYWKKRVYLASYPRSGNHWMRYLIEEATGIATSSVYKDVEYTNLIATPFPWGGYCNDRGYNNHCRYPEQGETVVIKTHFPHIKMPFDQLPAYKVIRIIRHPVDAMYSYYVYLCKLLNRIPEKPIPKNELYKQMTAWSKFEKYWDSQPNVITIRYEDLLNNPEAILRSVLRELEYKFEEEDVQRAVRKHPPEGKVLKHLSLYSQEDLGLIQSTLFELMSRYGYQIP